MYAKPYDRKFGIEFEFSCPGIPDHGEWGYREDNKIQNFRSLLDKNGWDDWNIGRDGSEWEIKTGILDGPNGFRKVKKFLGIVNDLGGFVTSSDGLHVHHDAPEFIGNAELTLGLVKNWFANQEEIFKMVGPIRKGRGCCPSWDQQNVETYERRMWDPNYTDSDVMYQYGRKNLNISSLRRHGTIEVRLHEGTLNYDEVLAWVRFGQAFIGKALDETDSVLEAMPTPNDLLKRIKVSRNASRFISTKVQTYDPSLVNVRAW